MERSGQIDDYWHIIDPVWDAIDLSGDGDAYLASIASVAPGLAKLCAAHLAQSEICNGGFVQFFENSSGVLAPEAVEGFCQLGMVETAQVVKAAMQLVCEPYSRDWHRRHGLLASHIEALNLLDDEFYSLIEQEADGFQSAADRFATTLRGDRP